MVLLKLFLNNIVSVLIVSIGIFTRSTKSNFEYTITILLTSLEFELLENTDITQTFSES